MIFLHILPEKDQKPWGNLHNYNFQVLFIITSEKTNYHYPMF